MTTEHFSETNKFETVSFLDIDRIATILLEKYTFDLYIYAPTFLNRRMLYVMQKYKISTVDEFLKRLQSPDFFNNILFDLSVSRTEFFRDATAWESYLKVIIEQCNSKNNIQIWFPDCGNGEELYSFTILLKQNGLYNKCSITASNISNEKITFIKQGLYEGKGEKTDSLNQSKGGLSISPLAYFKVIDTAIQVDSTLLNNVTFNTSLAISKQKKQNFDVVFFRNAMLFYEKLYQINVLENIYKSMCSNGLLIIGINEQLLISESENKFKIVNKIDRIYQKI